MTDTSTDSPRLFFESYLAKLERDSRVRLDTARTPLVRRVGRRIIPSKFRLGTRLAATAALESRARRDAARFSASGHVKLHLGSGPVHKAGWVDVDLAGDPVDLVWNVAKPLPFEDGSVDAIFHEFLMHHLPLDHGYRLTREAFRVLTIGGVLRICDIDCGVPEVAWPDAPTRLLALQEFHSEPEHRTMYDFETLAFLLQASGFRTVEQRQFRDSRLQPAPDSEHRQIGALYVEAVKE